MPCQDQVGKAKADISGMVENLCKATANYKKKRQDLPTAKPYHRCMRFSNKRCRLTPARTHRRHKECIGTQEGTDNHARPEEAALATLLRNATDAHSTMNRVSVQGHFFFITIATARQFVAQTSCTIATQLFEQVQRSESRGAASPKVHAQKPCPSQQQRGGLV